MKLILASLLIGLSIGFYIHPTNAQRDKAIIMAAYEEGRRSVILEIMDGEIQEIASK